MTYTAQVSSIEQQQFISPAGEQTSIGRHRELVLRVAEDAVQVRSMLHAIQARVSSRSLSGVVVLQAARGPEHDKPPPDEALPNSKSESRSAAPITPQAALEKLHAAKVRRMPQQEANAAVLSVSQAAACSTG